MGSDHAGPFVDAVQRMALLGVGFRADYATGRG